MTYKILRVVEKQPVAALNSLEEKVAAALADGWTPSGGASLVVTGSGGLDRNVQCIACQSVTKPEWIVIPSSRVELLQGAEKKLVEALATMDALPAPYQAFEQDARNKVLAGIDCLHAAQKHGSDN